MLKSKYSCKIPHSARNDSLNQWNIILIDPQTHNFVISTAGRNLECLELSLC